jgi:streptogramin lyase
MLALSFANDDSSFSVYGSNVQHVADFGSTTPMAFARYYAMDNSNVGFIMGVSNLSETASMFTIGELSGTENAPVSSVSLSLFNGKVGIGGILEPAEQLEVAGNVLVSGQISVNSSSSPFLIDSSVVVTNLNADLLDGQDGSFFRNAANINMGTLPPLRGGTGMSSPTAGHVLVGNGNSPMISSSNLAWNNDSKILNVTGAVQATSFIGDGSLLTGISGTGGGDSVWSTTSSGVYALGSMTWDNNIKNLNIGGSLQTSNLTIWNSLNIPLTSTTLRTRIQVQPVHGSFLVSGTSQTQFSVYCSGIYAGHSSNAQVFVGRTHQTYISPAVKDYDMTVTYASTTTEYLISLTEPAAHGDIVDITVWPQIIQESPEEQGIVYQSVTVTGGSGSGDSGSLWSQSSSTNNIYVTGSNVGIGTTSPQKPLDIVGDVGVNGTLHMTGNVIPTANETYDLGSSTMRFRDLFLSGTTIHIGTTSLSADPITGGLVVATPTSVQPLTGGGDIVACNVQVSGTVSAETFIGDGSLLTGIVSGGGSLWSQSSSNLYVVGSNVGIGMTNPTSQLHVVGDTRIEGNLTVNGTQTIVNTNIGTTEQLIITNDGTGPALVINQTGSQPVLDVQDDGVSVLKIIDGGNVGLGTTLPQSTLHVEGDMNVTGIFGDNLLATAPYLVFDGTTSIRDKFLSWMQYVTSYRYRSYFASSLIKTSTWWNTNSTAQVYDSLTYSTVAASGVTNYAYQGCVLVPDGRVVFVPHGANSTIGIFNPVINAYSTIVMSPSPTVYAYYGGVLLPDGRVVFVPAAATTIGIFNPLTNAYSTIPGAPGSGAYAGGVLVPDGRVVFVPNAATTIGLFNPLTNAYSTIPGAPGGGAYSGGVLVPDGRVIFVPYNATTVGIFNPATNTYSTISGNAGYTGGVLLPDGRIVFVPNNASTIGIFNPVTNTFTTITNYVKPGNDAYRGGMLLPDGRVVFVPHTATTIGIFNPLTNTYSTVAGAPGSNAYIGSVLLPDGRAIFVPGNVATVGILNTSQKLRAPPLELCYHPCFNKF